MTIRRAEIWLVNFQPNIGDEIKKARPAVVVNDDRIGILQTRTVVPITEWAMQYGEYPWMIRIEADERNGLTKTSAVDCFQIKNLSHARFVKKLGAIDRESLFRIHRTILKTFDLTYEISETL